MENYSLKRKILEPLITALAPLFVVDAIYSFSFSKIVFHAIFG